LLLIIMASSFQQLIETIQARVHQHMLVLGGMERPVTVLT